MGLWVACRSQHQRKSQLVLLCSSMSPRVSMVARELLSRTVDLVLKLNESTTFLGRDLSPETPKNIAKISNPGTSLC